MSGLFRISGATRRDPRIEDWFAGAPRLDREIDRLFHEPADSRRQVARTWFERMRACGPDVLECLHDGCPVACVQDAPFGYVNVFKTHVGVGFFQGASLDDATGLLTGEGKRMRHVKLRLGEPVDEDALGRLVAAAYRDIRMRLGFDGD